MGTFRTMADAGCRKGSDPGAKLFRNLASGIRHPIKTKLVALLVLIFAVVPVLAQDKQARNLMPVVSLVIGDKETAFKTPCAVAVDAKNGEIYVADQEGNSVHVLGADGKEKTRFDIPSPVSLALDSKGRLYVVDAKGGIAAYDFRGKKEVDIVPSGLPEGAAKTVARQVMIDENDNVFVADLSNQSILSMTPEGKLIRSFGAIGEKEKGTKFKGLNSFWISKTKVYVVDDGSLHVTVLSRASGDFLFRFGEQGGTSGKLAAPVSIAVDSVGRIYVLDTVRHCVSIFDEEGGFLAECGGEGKTAGWFYYPNTINRDANGRFYVCESTTRRVQVFTIPIKEKK